METETCPLCGKDYPATNGQCNSCADNSNGSYKRALRKAGIKIVRGMSEQQQVILEGRG